MDGYDNTEMVEIWTRSFGDIKLGANFDHIFVTSFFCVFLKNGEPTISD